jgi:kynureninase
VLVDLYHAAGALPLDIALLDADFAIGGCYKYLRGGPGAGFLYLHPRHLDGRLATLDSGWFAQAEPFQFTRRETPQLARGGDAFLEATPAVLPFYQARAGLDLVLALGAERLRDYALRQQLLLCERFAEEGVPVRGEASRRGNFLALPHGRAKEMSERLAASDITVDAREGFLRLCPDILNTSRELAAVAWRLGKLFREG